MTITSLADEIGLPSLDEALFEGFSREHEDSVKAASSYLAQRIRENTVDAEDIDSFISNILKQLPAIQQSEVLEYLLAKKGILQCQAGAIENGLIFYGEALSIKETPSTWALKGTAPLQIERLDEAFEAFSKAFELRQEFGVQKQGYLSDLITTWSTSALLRGLNGILDQDITEAQKGVEEYLSVSTRISTEDPAIPLGQVEAGESASDELKTALEELELMVKLLSIEDPFEGWRALSEEVSSVWPKDISALEAIREQRR